MLTEWQRNKHWRLWSRVKAVLMKGRETWTKHEEDQRRHEFYKKAGCRATSLTKFGNPDLDAFIKEAMSILEPDNVNAQLRQLRQAHKRAMWRLQQLMDEMDIGPNYVNGVIEQIDNGTDPNLISDFWQRERERTGQARHLEELTADELGDVISALRRIKRRGGAKVRDYVLK